MELLTKASFSNDVTQRELDDIMVAYRAACEGIVLLENNGVLPLKERRIALFGPGASHTTKGGTGSGEVNERHSVNIWEGLENRGFQVTTDAWLRDYERIYADAVQKRLRQARRKVLSLRLRSVMDLMFSCGPLPDGRRINDFDIRDSGTDTCIYVLSRQAGEGNDRRLEKGDYYLTDGERADIAACAGAYKNFVLVINSGAQVDLSFMDEINGIDALVYICQLGTQGGNALADVLSGQVVPSGKLADTWVRRYEDIPFANDYSYLNGDLENEYYREGIYVGYRYYDSFRVQPRYPFGYGRTYTVFSRKMLQISHERGAISLKVNVTNTGNAAGREVVQLYVSAPPGKLHREYQSLAAFAKTGLLQSGESQELLLRFSMEALAAFREEDASFVLEEGPYCLRLGDSSRHTELCAVVVLAHEVTVSRHHHICPAVQPVEELKAEYQGEMGLDGYPTIVLSADDFDTAEYTYGQEKGLFEGPVEAFLDELSPEEMIRIVVGAGMFGGKNRFQLPGSVGNTTSDFWERGLANIALCDGPAGVRLQKRSTVGKKGNIKMLDAPMALFELLPAAAKKLLYGDPGREPVIYQFTTAFPVATAIAQSWNEELAREIGCAVAREMVEYGCTFWLAPAVNIHRNPLCGRNFEYFSEDPLLTGVMAAAITRGVQSEEGCFVTVKHFACNNQEDNRNAVSSNLSERALREIYLRGFEMAVRLGEAKGIMTSYNKINGTYAPNSYDLCTKVLRDEWGFDGVVMTDWFSTNRGLADNGKAIAAGNDLIMPGGSAYEKDLLKALRAGEIDLKALRRCCGNVVRAVMASRTQREYIHK